MSDSPTVMNSTEEAYRLAEFRQRIARRLVDDSGEKQREMREEGLGYLLPVWLATGV
jgi:hypothetical protein